MKLPCSVFAIASLLFCLIGQVMSSPTSTRIPQPRIVTKSQWGSMKEGDFWENQPFDPYSQGLLGDPVAITLHHTYIPAGPSSPDPEVDKKNLIFIQQFHVSKGWGDIGYHYLIGSDGTIYEGRPIGFMGTHAPPNYRNIGVNIIGDFHEKEYPSEAQLNGFVQLVSWLCDRYDIDPASTIDIFGEQNIALSGHRDWKQYNKTACPGDRLYALLSSLRERVRSVLLDGPAYDCRIHVNQFLPETLLAGRTCDLALTIRNTGYALWSHLNRVRLESATPGVLSVAEPALKDGETVGNLSNRTWQTTMTPSSPGNQRFALYMFESDRRFGPELAWESRVLPPDAFISQWLVLGPFAAKAPDAAFATDFLAGKPLDTLDVMDRDSESLHGYAVVGEYDSGECNFRGEDGERFKDSGRYYRGEETFRLSLTGYRGGDLALRRLTDAGMRDQVAYVYIDGRRLSYWKLPGRQQFRRWKDTDIVIPALHLQKKDSITVRVKSVGTKQWGCNSFRYSLLDSAESLVRPRADDRFGGLVWKPWRSSAGVIDVASLVPKAESGAVYLAAYAKSPSTGWVQLRIGYSGYVKAYMNGVEVLAGKTDSPCFPDTLRGEALLKQGWNVLLLKVVLEPGAKDLYVRLSDRNGEPLKSLSVELEPAGKSDPELVASR